MSSESQPRAQGGSLDPKKLLREAIAGGDSDYAQSGWQPPPVEQLAEQFPEFEVLELIGRGGMGAVYKVVQSKLDRTVALKVLPPELAQDPAFEERFLREARALAGLKHERILTLHDFGERGGLFYLVTEFVAGMNLRQLMDMGELSPFEALRIAPQICDALQYAHDHGVVHRDIKPENLLIDLDGEVRIADFGLARIVGDGANAPALTRSTQVLGTPQYMAPEQWRDGQNVDHRADIYSVGVVLYEMLTGQLPIGHFDMPSRKQGVPPGLDAVVQRSLAQRPEERYQQASEVSSELARNALARDAKPAQSDRTSAGDQQASAATAPARLPKSLHAAWSMLLLLVCAYFGVVAYAQLSAANMGHATSQGQPIAAAAAQWAKNNGVPQGMNLVTRYYKEVLLQPWEQRQSAAAARNEPFTEPKPILQIPSPAEAKRRSVSMLRMPAVLAAFVFTFLGFSSVAQIRRRRQTKGLALAVFTALILPLVLAVTIPVSLVLSNVRNQDTAVLAATTLAFVLGLCGILAMNWYYRSVKRAYGARTEKHILAS